MTARPTILVMSALHVGLLSVQVAAAAPCESLKALTLPNTTITIAESIAGGAFQAPGAPPPPPIVLPSRCRVTALLTPSSDSRIEMEVWLPIDNWNGKFQAVGNGGWAGTITFGGVPQPIPRNMAFALREGYATASTDTGHRNDGTQGRFAVGHPEKLVDFAYRAVHEMTVASKAIIAASTGRGRGSPTGTGVQRAAARDYSRHSASPRTSMALSLELRPTTGPT